MADRIFKFENRNVQDMFCRIIHNRLGIPFTYYHRYIADALLIDTNRKLCISRSIDSIRYKAYLVVTGDLIDAMSIILDDDALIEFLFS